MFTLRETNIAMENPPCWWYFPGKMGIFQPAMLVYQRVSSPNSKIAEELEEWLIYPYHPCMVYFPIKVRKYTTHISHKNLPTKNVPKKHPNLSHHLGEGGISNIRKKDPSPKNQRFHWNLQQRRGLFDFLFFWEGFFWDLQNHYPRSPSRSLKE